jgi:hypothetical protein
MPASSRVLLDALALGGMGLEGAACDSGSDRVAPGSGLEARSCPAAAHAPAAPPARRHRPRRSCGRAGSWSWRALTNSSWKPCSSSTCQTGFQQLAGGLHHHLGDAFGGQPPSQRLQSRGEGRERAYLLGSSATPIRDTHAGHHLVLGDIQPGAARVKQLHRRHLPCRWVVPGRANRGNDAETRAHSNSSWCRDGPRISRLNGLCCTKESRAWPGPPILIPRGGHKPWRSYQQSRAYRYATLRFRRSPPSVKGEVMRSNRAVVCVQLSWLDAR